MKKRIGWYAWFLGLILFATFYAAPWRTGLSRSILIALLGLEIVSWLVLIWRRPVARILSLSVLALIALAFLLPSKGIIDQKALREIYVRQLRHYDGTIYVYGGENCVGIDCSGLVRRGMVDALFVYGLEKWDPGALRASLYLWWHDSNAIGLGQGRDDTRVATSSSSNRLSDHAAILPGDLAVTASGSHVIAYLGNETWIEAEPNVGHTHIFNLSGPFHPLSDERVRFVRWVWLDQDETIGKN